jgi:isoleucyl-tRNA synthetase
MLDGDPIELAAEEILVQSQPATGLVVASEKSLTVAVDVTITPALEQEGHARELVRHIQQLRKDANLEISDRIVAYIAGSPLIPNVLENFGDYVCAETLTVELVQVEQGNAVPARLPQTRFDLDDIPVVVAVEKKR